MSLDLRHGRHTVKVVNNIVIIDIHEAFNEYDIKAITTDLKLLIENFQGNGFFLLIDILNSEGGTPEAFEESRIFNLWLDTQNLLAKAIICSSPALIVINESRVRDTNKQLIQYFDDKKNALNWFGSLL